MHNRRVCELSDCQTCRNMRRAMTAFLANAQARLTGDTIQESDPVLWADAQTSYHDLRAALCLAGGVSVDEIDPATGHYRQGGVPDV